MGSLNVNKLSFIGHMFAGDKTATFNWSWGSSRDVENQPDR